MLANIFMSAIHNIYFFGFLAPAYTTFNRLDADFLYIMQGNAHYKARSHITSNPFVIRNRTLRFFCELDKLLIRSSVSILPGYTFDCHNAKRQPLYLALYEEGMLFMILESSSVNDVCARCRQASVQQQSVSERRRMCR